VVTAAVDDSLRVTQVHLLLVHTAAAVSAAASAVALLLLLLAMIRPATPSAAAADCCGPIGAPLISSRMWQQPGGPASESEWSDKEQNFSATGQPVEAC